MLLRPFHFIELSYMSLTIFRFFFILVQNWEVVLYRNKKFLQNLIFILLWINLLSLSPYNVCTSCYFWNVLVVSFLLFFPIILKTFLYRWGVFIAHLLPLQRPVRLWDILFYLEIIRTLIRPLTLRLRITCNLLTGHIIIALSSSLNKCFIVFIIILYFFENLIRIIQSQVLTMLLRLYKKS